MTRIIHTPAGSTIDIRNENWATDDTRLENNWFKNSKRLLPFSMTEKSWYSGGILVFIEARRVTALPVFDPIECTRRPDKQ